MRISHVLCLNALTLLLSVTALALSHDWSPDWRQADDQCAVRVQILDAPAPRPMRHELDEHRTLYTASAGFVTDVRHPDDLPAGEINHCQCSEGGCNRSCCTCGCRQAIAEK